jgi:hypothetical protein
MTIAAAGKTGERMLLLLGFPVPMVIEVTV